MLLLRYSGGLNWERLSKEDMGAGGVCASDIYPMTSSQLLWLRLLYRRVPSFSFLRFYFWYNLRFIFWHVSKEIEFEWYFGRYCLLIASLLSNLRVMVTLFIKAGACSQ